jgi:hypothetical protein
MRRADFDLHWQMLSLLLLPLSLPSSCSTKMNVAPSFATNANEEDNANNANEENDDDYPQRELNFIYLRLNKMFEQT